MIYLHGSWIGSIAGSNYGWIFVEIQQSEVHLSGIASIADLALGAYFYDVDGTVTGDEVALVLTPQPAQPGITLGPVQVSGRAYGTAALAGTWTSTLGTGGVFELRRQELLDTASRKVFVVHGHDVATKQEVTRYLEHLQLVPIVLDEIASSGSTIVEKVEANADVRFSVVLLTPDDVGYPSGRSESAHNRARQNVIFEFGYFLAKLSRRNVCALKKGDIELPSDYGGVVFIPVDDAGGWKLKLAAEIKASGIPIDLNRLL